MNGDQTHFLLKIRYHGTVYCNLPQTRPGEYEGDSSTVTLMGGMVAARTMGAYTIVYPAYVSLAPQESALGLNLQSIAEMDSCLRRMNQLLGTDYKNTLLQFFIPLIAAWLLVPLTVWGFYMLSGKTEDITDASPLIQMYLPFLPIWWTVFVCRQYVDGGGQELLHMHCKTQLWECLFFQVLLLLIVAVPYVFLSFFSKHRV